MKPERRIDSSEFVNNMIDVWATYQRSVEDKEKNKGDYHTYRYDFDNGVSENHEILDALPNKVKNVKLYMACLADSWECKLKQENSKKTEG